MVRVFVCLLAVAISSLAGPADWVPARWYSNDPATLELVRGTAVNCLVLDRGLWSPAFGEKAAALGVTLLGSVKPGEELEELAAKASAAKLKGLVFEGAFPGDSLDRIAASVKDSHLAVVKMGPRTRLNLVSPDEVVATFQGVWPGINAAEDGSAKAAPSGAPWIDTNTGFLRFVRAALPAGSKSRVWMGYAPPAKQVIPVARYLQAIADAEMLGAHWLITLDGEMSKRLMAREEKAVDAWKKMTAVLSYFQAQGEWREASAYGGLALVQDVDSGGLYSGGILDMISVKHTPVMAVPRRKLNDAGMKQAKMAVNVDPTLLSDEQKEVLRRFTRGGGTLLTAPPGWKFPQQREDQITLDKEDVKILDQIWKEVNSMTGRHNLGARLFNVASVLSYLAASADGTRVALQLVSYSDYEVENVTVHLLGKWKSVKLLAPGRAERSLPVFETDDGTGVELDRLGVAGVLVAESGR
ncbi:MAG: hypothetical protein IPJ98_04495 [Bryobacterales bacterium]|nr:hypothetical protein [Bryobacterales bacterium]